MFLSFSDTKFKDSVLKQLEYFKHHVGSNALFKLCVTAFEVQIVNFFWNEQIRGLTKINNNCI